MNHSQNRDFSKSTVDWGRFVEMVTPAKRFLLTAHVRPDGDCIGSELAMAAMLRQLGKEVRVLNVDRVPPDLQFLDGTDEIEYLDSFDDQPWLDSLDVILVLDTLSWAQLGRMRPILESHSSHGGLILAVDHHAIGDDIGALVFRNTEAEAAGRLVFEAARHLNIELTPEIATALFVAIATDTGWFRFSAVTADTFFVIGELIRAGAIPHVIYNYLYEQASAGKVRLVGRTLAKIELFLEGKLAFTSILAEDFAQSGALPCDSEDIVNKTLEIGGTKMAVIVVEQQTGGFKVSFRSRCHVDCSRVAAQFGGGGHRQASGASQELPFDELKTLLIDAMIAAYNEYCAGNKI